METPLNAMSDGPCPGARFDTTQWGMVLEAARGDSEHAREAMETLCCRYWPLLFAFARGLGHGEADAQDLTQAFFADFLDRKALQRADPARGRFRTFLLTSFRRFMASEWKKAGALKRGGPTVCVPLEEPDAREVEPAADATQGEAFDRDWARHMFTNALKRLREQFVAAGQALEFERLREFLARPGDEAAYARIAADLGWKSESVAVAVHRLRRRYGEVVRAEVARTVPVPDDVEPELQYLIEIVGR